MRVGDSATAREGARPEKGRLCGAAWASCGRICQSANRRAGPPNVMKTKRTAGSSAAAGSGCPRKAACGQNSPPHGRLSTAPTWCRENKTKINSVPNWGDLWYVCPTRAPKQKACKAGTRKRDDQEIRLRAALAKFPWNALGRGRFHGTWKLNVGKSTFAKGRELKELTVTIAEQGENQVFTIKGTLGNGNPLSFKYSENILYQKKQFVKHTKI